MTNKDTVCKTHPNAPHSFNRNASLSEDRYVCDCEYWEPVEMNERLEDLMYEAGLTAQGCWDSFDEYDQIAIKKFALLIVEECALRAETYSYMSENFNELAKELRKLKE